MMTKLGLTLNETKTSVKNARLESFDFLGYTLGPRRFPNGGRWYLGAAPSKKSVLRIKRKVSELLTPGNKGAWPEVQARLNRLLGGWSAYFSYGSLATAHQAVDRHVFDRVLAFLRRRHNTPGRGVRRFSREIYGNPGVLVLRGPKRRKPPTAIGCSREIRSSRVVAAFDGDRRGVSFLASRPQTLPCGGEVNCAYQYIDV
jgi:RNA-directed DNA polymerase